MKTSLEQWQETISPGILEAAALSCGDDINLQREWIEEFEAVVNAELPDGVYIDLGTCQQAGPGHYLPRSQWEQILHDSETDVDEDFYQDGRIGGD